MFMHNRDRIGILAYGDVLSSDSFDNALHASYSPRNASRGVASWNAVAIVRHHAGARARSQACAGRGGEIVPTQREW